MSAPLPPGWISQFDPSSGRYFFVHTPTGQTTWTDPRGPLPAPYVPPAQVVVQQAPPPPVYVQSAPPVYVQPAPAVVYQQPSTVIVESGPVYGAPVFGAGAGVAAGLAGGLVLGSLLDPW
ncbi:hypothetical protein M427DRAFT_147099 [Gonapodya prolifera JEL478]|uniref:WW domain-containing protein n=1 Tax=Gonapodya prolifera (strain JEL478) TaxID=1344416 RepID=A0A139A6F4_GONPJ|nr:hypothetical protein M427DRAFT_147099 [Gonapodya prolifera JEL478]|eukprot:KXS12382.1 hypothetical protein M427DRAFT_147099 [Gonapodya prolifera JEL478]